MALSVPATLDEHRPHPARSRTLEAPVQGEVVRPVAADLPVETGIPPETRMLGFVMIYMLAVAFGVGALLVRLW